MALCPAARLTMRMQAFKQQVTVHRRDRLLGSTITWSKLMSQQVQTAATSPRCMGAAPCHADQRHKNYMAAAAQLIPKLSDDRSKGDAGKVATIGGCREYTGAPYFAAISALKVGADLSHVFCTEGAATVIKSYSPELIVHPYLPDSSSDDSARTSGISAQQMLETKRRYRSVEHFNHINHWLPRFDVVVIGPGLGRDPWVHDTVVKVLEALREDNRHVVIDADGLHIAIESLHLLKGWTNATLTPNANEFKRVAAAVSVDIDEKDSDATLEKVVRALDGPTIVQKGDVDRVSDGSSSAACAVKGSPRRAGGQGDVLSGTMAVFKSWAAADPSAAEAAAASARVSTNVLAAWSACAVARIAASAAYQGRKRSMVASDVIAALGAAMESVTYGRTDSAADVYCEFVRMEYGVTNVVSKLQQGLDKSS